MRRAYLLILFGFLLLPLAFLGCSTPPDEWREAKPGQKKILVSFPPLYTFTHAIAGEKAYVLCLLTEQGPHGYDGSAGDILMVNGADLFIYNGMSLDDEFVSMMLKGHKNRTLQTLNVGGILEKEHKWVLHGAGPAAPGHEGHDHGEHDPHIWLGNKQAKEMSKHIAAKLVELDPEHKANYEKNLAKLTERLDDLHKKGVDKLKDKKERNIVTMHEAFKYFAHRKYGFDIKIKEVIQVKPGVDPDAVSLAKLIKACEDHKVTVIAKEPQYPDAQAEMIRSSLKRKGIDVTIITLDPLETAPRMEGKLNPDPEYYFKGMEANIDALAKALR